MNDRCDICNGPVRSRNALRWCERAGRHACSACHERPLGAFDCQVCRGPIATPHERRLCSTCAPSIPPLPPPPRAPDVPAELRVTAVPPGRFRDHGGEWAAGYVVDHEWEQTLEQLDALDCRADAEVVEHERRRGGR